MGALDASLGMRVQLALGRSWPLESHLPGAPASGLTEKKYIEYKIHKDSDKICQICSAFESLLYLRPLCWFPGTLESHEPCILED